MSATPDQDDLFTTGRLVRHLQLRLERLDGENAGKLRISTPQARGWAATVRPHPDALWNAIREAFTEATIAGYAAWQNDLYDHDELTDVDDPTEPRRGSRLDVEQLAQRAETRTVVSWSKYSLSRPDVRALEEWTPLPDGRWLEPNGRRKFPRSASQVQRMLRNRARAGLPVSYEEHQARRGGECGDGA